MQSNQLVHHPVVRHITRNFNIFGFGTEHSALLQSTKELIENSIDACRMNTKSGASASSKISITIIDAESGVFLDVTDNGMGIADPTSVLRCFQTGKDGEQTRTAGRFGVGLSTCLIYSLVNTGTPMRIVTKCGAVMEATVADFSLDLAQNPVCVQSKSIALVGMQSGTKIRVHLPLAASDRQETLRDGTMPPVIFFPYPSTNVVNVCATSVCGSVRDSKRLPATPSMPAPWPGCYR
jgi:DNA topoisomerase VI subunit B